MKKREKYSLLFLSSFFDFSQISTLFFSLISISVYYNNQKFINTDTYFQCFFFLTIFDRLQFFFVHFLKKLIENFLTKLMKFNDYFQLNSKLKLKKKKKIKKKMIFPTRKQYKKGAFLMLYELFLFFYFFYKYSKPETIPNFCFHLRNPLPKNITINGRLHYFPPNHTVEIFHFKTKINDTKNDYIRFYKYKDHFKTNVEYYPGVQDDLNSIYRYLDAKIIHLNDVFISECASIAIPGDNIKFVDLEKIRGKAWIRRHDNGPLKGELENVIAVGHLVMYIFSHWFYDFLAPLVMFPQSIINKSILLSPYNDWWHVDSLVAIGINKSQIKHIGRGEWYHAENAFVCFEPLCHIAHYGSLMTTLSKKLREHLKLEEINATKYSIANRAKGRRHLLNWKDIKDAIIKAYPDVNFSVIGDIFWYKEAAIEWAKAKMMFMPTGSNFVKNIFMKEGSVLVVGLANVLDDCIALTAAAHRCSTLFFPMEHVDHHCNYTGGYCDPDVVVRAVGIGLYCAQHGNWNPKETFVYP